MDAATVHAIMQQQAALGDAALALAMPAGCFYPTREEIAAWYMEVPDHTWRQQAHLAASGEGLTYYDTSSSMPAQAAAASNPSIAKRKRGRPKGPNPLEDPTISEKQARRIMANRASVDRSNQRKKMQEAAARQYGTHTHAAKKSKNSKKEDPNWTPNYRG